MIKTRLLLFLFFMIMGASCINKENNLLRGKWAFQKVILPDNRIFSINDSASIRTEKEYEFLQDNMYIVETVQYKDGDGELIVKKGNFELTDDNDKLYLTLKEKQLEGVGVSTFHVLTLNETDLIWESERKSRYFFTKVQSGN